MRQETVNIYKYDELSDKAKRKVLERYREHNDFLFLSNDLKEELNTLLEEHKIEVQQNLQLYYSLSYSQGDGCCFVGDFIWNNYRISIKHDNSCRYYHNQSVDININSKFNSNGEDVEISSDEENVAYNEFKNIYKEICDKLEDSGYAIIDNENSEEYIKDSIEANEEEFYDNGDIF